MRGDDAGYALGARRNRAYSSRAAYADRKWSAGQTLTFIVGASACLWTIIWGCLHRL